MERKTVHDCEGGTEVPGKQIPHERTRDQELSEFNRIDKVQTKIEEHVMLTGLEKMRVTVDEVGTFGPSKDMFPAKTPTPNPSPKFQVR